MQVHISNYKRSQNSENSHLIFKEIKKSNKLLYLTGAFIDAIAGQLSTQIISISLHIKSFRWIFIAFEIFHRDKQET